MEPILTQKPAKAEIVKNAKAYVQGLLEEKLPAQLVYHSPRHTATVVKEAKALGEAAGLNEADQEALVLAAWFHDTGYIDTYDGHEFRSAELAGEWLAQQRYAPERTALVQQLIKATHRDSARETELEQLLVDADMSGMGREDFFANAELLRAEWEATLGKTYSNTDWAEDQLAFLSAGSYYTKAAKDRYQEQLKDNIKEQRKQLKKT